MSSPSHDKPHPALPPYQPGSERPRRSSVYTQSNAGSICPRATIFGGNSQSFSTFYAFPRLPEVAETPVETAQKKRLDRPLSFPQRIASTVFSLLGGRPMEKAETKNLLLDPTTGKSLAVSEGAHVFCQHITNAKCQCTVTMPVAVGRSRCQTCADGQCAGASDENDVDRDIKCRHHWVDKCQCTSSALWVTGSDLCGPCWYGQCQVGKEKQKAD